MLPQEPYAVLASSNTPAAWVSLAFPHREKFKLGNVGGALFCCEFSALAGLDFVNGATSSHQMDIVGLDSCALGDAD